MKTTLNIRVDILQQIIQAAQAQKMSCSSLILLLISKVAGDIVEYGRIGTMVQYQDRQGPEDWHPFHIKLREDMYEYWLDLRKLLKMSVSLILAYAVRKYLGKTYKMSSGDNYLFKNYFIIKDVIDNIIIWKFIWGCPFNLEQIIKRE